jgi:hypothetical protein
MLTSTQLLAAPVSAGAKAPRFAVIVPQTSNVQTASLREALEAALRADGATIVPNTELREAARTLDVSADLPPDRETAQRLSSALALDGIVELQVNPVKPAPATGPKYQAELRVIGPDGAERVETQVPVAGRTLSTKEADTLADIAVQSVKPPTRPPVPPTLPPAERTEANQVPAPVITGPPVPTTTEPKRERSLLILAAPNITWRSGAVNAAPPAPSVTFDTGSPYLGFTLAMELNPFLGDWSRFIGFDALYSFSVLGINTVNPQTNLTQRETATENRIIVDVIGHSPKPIFGGDLALRLGFAYQGFSLNPVGSLVTSQHTGPRVFLGYQRALFKGVAIGFGAGWRPFAIPGDGLTTAFGDREQSYGLEANGGFSGPLEFVVRHLRWMVAYDFLRYSDRFGSTGGATTNIENYNRILVGFTYQAPLHF